MPGILDNLYIMRDCKTKRISSYDRTGGNADFIEIGPRQTAVLADIPGCGIIRHIWITINTKDPMIRRNSVLRMYWNGEENPSVESPIGDFFGQGFGEEYNLITLPLAAAPANGRALNCYFPMPFTDGARITIENQSDIKIDNFYYYIDYEVHGKLPENTAMFHARWRREITAPHGDYDENEWNINGPCDKNCSDANNYLIADIEGKGHFVGVNYYVDSPTPMWYGEGDDMWMIDGEEWPGSLHGTGTEDFFNTSWCPNEVYTHPFFGIARVPGRDKVGWMGRTHLYRFMIEDPVYFEKSLRFSIEHGHANNLTLDLSSVAYWYQTEPHKVFTPLLDIGLRQPMPEIGLWQIHKWRLAWRMLKGTDDRNLWGNED